MNNNCIRKIKILVGMFNIININISRNDCKFFFYIKDKNIVFFKNNINVNVII